MIRRHEGKAASSSWLHFHEAIEVSEIIQQDIHKPKRLRQKNLRKYFGLLFGNKNSFYYFCTPIQEMSEK